MSTGPFLTGAAAALVLSMSMVAASASVDKPLKGRHGSHEVASSAAYTAAFPSHGALCSASGSPRATSVGNGSPFAAFNGGGAYSASFFNGGAHGFASTSSSSNGGFGGGFAGGAGAAKHAGTSAGQSGANTNAPSNGRQQRGNSGSPLASAPSTGSVPGTAAATTPLGGTLKLKTSTPSATPEPATLLLLTTGVGGLLVARRRRKG